MDYKIITPREMPLTMVEMREHLKLDPADAVHPLDALTQARCGAACDFAQHYTGHGIGLQVVETVSEWFPDKDQGLTFSPVVGIVSVKYKDAAGVVQTCAQGSYDLYDYGSAHKLRPAYGVTWPTVRAHWDAVKIQYACGYDAAALPDAVRSALLLILGHLHKNNQAVSQLKLEEVPLGAIALLDTVKIWGM